MGEPADVSRVLFPGDYNTAAVVMREVYQTQGQIWTLVVPKVDGIPDLFTEDEATRLFRDGALRLDWAGHQPAEAQVVLTAVGAYQLGHALRASARLTERGVAHGVNYMLEPGRFRAPRSLREGAHVAPEAVRERLYPPSALVRVFLTHTRPEILLGAIHPVCTGPLTVGLGFSNHGGTLDTGGMLFVNGVTWAHALDAVARLLAMDRAALLTDLERAALDGRASPHGVLI